ncbi:hypothetical protein HRbin36_00141 [bacterium HR36]|nr:hypothetical protein HRbin36_00141 [bacterium HR36]
MSSKTNACWKKRVEGIGGCGRECAARLCWLSGLRTLRMGTGLVSLAFLASIVCGALQAEPVSRADKPAAPQPAWGDKPCDKQASPNSEKAPSASVRVQPWVTLGRETTFFTEPLDRFGYVDYAAALSQELGRGVPPEKNAYVLLLRAIGPRPLGEERLPDVLFRRLGMEPLPDQGEYFVPLAPYLREGAGLKNGAAIDSVLAQERVARTRSWREQDHPHLAAWLKANEKPLALVIEAAQRPLYFRPIVRTEKLAGDASELVMVSDLLALREMASALMLRAMLHVSHTDYGLAWRDLYTVLRIARLVGQAFSIEVLIGSALESTAANSVIAYLEHAPLTPAQWRQRLQELQNLPPRKPLADIVYWGERAFCLDFMQNLHLHHFRALASYHGGSEKTLLYLLAPKLFPWEKILRRTNACYDEIARALREPDRARRTKALRAFFEQKLSKLAKQESDEAQLKALLKILSDADSDQAEQWTARLIAMGYQPLLRVMQSCDRADQTHALLQTALVLHIYRLEQGQYPEKLKDLVPKYRADVPRDVFSGQPLIYRRTARGFLLYSVGPNEKDDGGRTATDKPPGDDIRVQIPKPEPSTP